MRISSTMTPYAKLIPQILHCLQHTERLDLSLHDKCTIDTHFSNRLRGHFGNAFALRIENNRVQVHVMRNSQLTLWVKLSVTLTTHETRLKAYPHTASLQISPAPAQYPFATRVIAYG